MPIGDPVARGARAAPPAPNFATLTRRSALKKGSNMRHRSAAVIDLAVLAVDATTTETTLGPGGPCDVRKASRSRCSDEFLSPSRTRQADHRTTMCGTASWYRNE